MATRVPVVAQERVGFSPPKGSVLVRPPASGLSGFPSGDAFIHSSVTKKEGGAPLALISFPFCERYLQWLRCHLE